MNKLVSIIVPCYNQAHFLGHALQSVLNQTYSNFELIIVNDCSTDKTKEIIKSFDDNRIIYRENEINIGRSRSRNSAIKIAKGNFIAIIDGDDISVPSRFDVQVNYLINNPTIDLVASNVIYFHGNKVLGSSILKFF